MEVDLNRKDGLNESDIDRFDTEDHEVRLILLIRVDNWLQAEPSSRENYDKTLADQLVIGQEDNEQGYA